MATQPQMNLGVPPPYAEATSNKYPDAPPSYNQHHTAKVPPSFYDNQRRLDECAQPYPVATHTRIIRTQVAGPASARPVIIAVDAEAIQKARDEAFRRRCAIWGTIFAVKVVVAIIVVAVLMS